MRAVRDPRYQIASCHPVHPIGLQLAVVNGDSLLNESSKGYYVCLVRQLSGAQANEAAAAIISACRTSNPL